MANFLNKIASAFVVTEDTTPVQTQENTQVEPQAVVSKPVSTGTLDSSQPFDQELANKLCARLEEVNDVKPDYIEFKQSMTDPEMVASIPSEASRMQIVFKVLKAGAPSLSKGFLVGSVDKYINYLNTWETEAQQELSGKREALAGKMNRITEISETIKRLEAEKVQLESQIALEHAQIETQDAKFTKTVKYLRSEFESDKEKINTNIKE